MARSLGLGAHRIRRVRRRWRDCARTFAPRYYCRFCAMMSHAAFPEVTLNEKTTMTDQSKPYTPLTTDNSALVLVDHQVGLMTGVRDYETGELKHNVVALAKAAKVLRIPTVVTTTARDSMWGPTFPELVEVVGGEHIIDRSSVNAWRSEEHTSE